MADLTTTQAQRAVLSILRATSIESMTPDLPSVQAAVKALRECVRELNKAASVDESFAGLVGDSVTQGAYPALLLARRGEFERASAMIVDSWKATLAALKASGFPVVPIELDAPDNLAEEFEFLSVLNVAVSQILRSEVNEKEARNILRRIATSLELSQDETGRMFGVSGETIRRWERGSHKIPSNRLAELVSADQSLSRLLRLFRSERVAQAVRREAPLFDGERALDWILRGRHAEVADRYENALMYQAS